MPQLPSREALESMKRTDLQKLCKDYGVKANLKSEALIDLLMDTAKPTTRQATTRRSVSARHATKSALSRTSSIIIHDTDEESEREEIEQGEKKSLDARQVDAQRNPPTEQTLPLTARTRKGKDQTRLGVGRPIIAGGTGPRAVTKSVSVSKGKHSKGSVSMRPVEATIVEEAEMEDTQRVEDSLHNETAKQVQNQTATPLASIEYLAEIDKRVADVLRPLHEQMKSMKQELELMQLLKAEVRELKAQVDGQKGLEEKVESLTATVQSFGKEMEDLSSLRVEINQLKGTSRIPSTPSTPKLQDLSKKRGEPSGFGFPSSLRETTQCEGLDGSHTVSTSDGPRANPGIAPSMLGKRPREYTNAQDTGNPLEGESVANDSLSGMQPLAKRAKLSEENLSTSETSDLAGDSQGDEVAQHIMGEANADSTLQFSGLESALVEPPPTDNLPDFFPPSSPVQEISTEHFTTSTATSAESQQPFAFSFQPMSSTPAHGLFMTSFPYPEPPQSPSPAGTNPPLLDQPQRGRSDVFQAFGFPPPGRPRVTGSRSGSVSGSGFINPAALTPFSSDRDQTGSPAEAETQSAGNEGVAKDADANSGTGTRAHASETKRTMYGTELEGDTRFGDFGVEGVGKNGKGSFWAGGRF